MALITKKKTTYRINGSFRRYLANYGRELELPISYQDLTRFDNSITLYDQAGKDTHWKTVFYPQSDIEHIYDALKKIYAYLKSDGNTSTLQHLIVERVDVCTYANTHPFRIRIVNKNNDNFDYFYIKNADASRIYGLELEHILSPNRISYATHHNTLVEEHIAGIPGEQFFSTELHDPNLNIIRIAKEFVKFNERCFVVLLGDMHSSNFVIVKTPDFEEVYYRIRPIDFDQQCYEGKRSVYQPQYFKQNNPIIELGKTKLTAESVKQYQTEERSLIASRLRTEKQRVYELLNIMARDEIAPLENVYKLRTELAQWYKNPAFLHCETMGQLVWNSLELVLQH
jgi:hypothetical protein